MRSLILGSVLAAAACATPAPPPAQVSQESPQSHTQNSPPAEAAAAADVPEPRKDERNDEQEKAIVDFRTNESRQHDHTGRDEPQTEARD